MFQENLDSKESNSDASPTFYNLLFYINKKSWKDTFELNKIFLIKAEVLTSFYMSDCHNRKVKKLYQKSTNITDSEGKWFWF